MGQKSHSSCYTKTEYLDIYIIDLVVKVEHWTTLKQLNKTNEIKQMK